MQTPAANSQSVPRKHLALWRNSRELGLAAGIFCGKYLLKTHHLHYGYWPENLPVKLANLATAQQGLADFILAHIPPGVTSILDVGCGAGAFASQLLSRGYRVEGVCPNPALVRQARKLLNGRATVYESTYEALDVKRRYDLVLFSESFQYMRIHKTLDKTLRYCKRGGYLLICDFFKTGASGECVMGGGQDLGAFYELISRYPFEKLKDIDITAQTAPTIDMVNNLLAPAAPFWRVARRILPGIQSSKVDRKYFSGLRTGQHFAAHKSYRLLLYRRHPKPSPSAPGP